MYRERLSETDYLYALAGADIQGFVSNAETQSQAAQTEIASIAAQDGLTVHFKRGKAHYSFQMERSGGLPQGWSWIHSCEGAEVHPDHHKHPSAERIEILERRVSALSEAFTQVCGRAAWEIAEKEESFGKKLIPEGDYSFERLGAEIVIKCPPFRPVRGTNGKQDRAWIVPAGATPITYAEYVRLREEAAPQIERKILSMPFSPGG